MDAEELQRRAIERALARGGARAVEPGAYPDTYRVRSNTRQDVVHSVSVDGDVWRCDCEAGLAHRGCWHQAAVLMHRLEQASGGRVTGPRRPRAEVALL